MPVGERGGVGGSGREVVFFARVGFEIEELLGAAGGAPEVCVATVGEGGEGLGGARRSTGRGQPNMRWQMITEATTPAKSATRPAAIAWRARRTATEPK